jgi:hypothetical protein
MYIILMNIFYKKKGILNLIFNIDKDMNWLELQC